VEGEHPKAVRCVSLCVLDCIQNQMWAVLSFTLRLRFRSNGRPKCEIKCKTIIREYPLYGVDPKNLLPICNTCNSKAKLAKDLLVKEGVRRLSFTPWTERALVNEIEVVVDDANELFPRVVVNFRSTDPDRQEKLATWDDVYKIKSRVEGEFKELAAKLAEDADAPDDTSFVAKLQDSGRAKARAERLTPFNYWRARVYAEVRSMNPRSREALRKATALTPQETHELDTLFF